MLLILFRNFLNLNTLKKIILIYCPNFSTEIPVISPPKAPPKGINPFAKDHKFVRVLSVIVSLYLSR